MSGLGIAAPGFGLSALPVFGGDILPRFWQPIGVQFPAGSALNQNGSALPATNKLTISGLFRIPSASLQWSTGGLSLIDIVAPGGLAFSVQLTNFASNSLIDAVTVAAVNNAGGSSTGAAWQTYTGNFDGTWPHTIALDAWHHLYVCVDTSIPANYHNFGTLTPTQFGNQNKKQILLIDGVNWSPKGTTALNYALGGGTTFPTFEVFNGAVYNSNFGPYTGDAGWTMPFNGANIGVPYKSGNPGWYYGAASSAQIVQLADFQMIVGQAIDPLAAFGNGTLAAFATGDNGNLIPELAQAMVAAGVDALFALTVMNIEVGFSSASLSANGTYNSLVNPQGIFQFNPQSEVIPALNYWAEPQTTWYTNNNYQSLAFLWNSVFWGITAQAQAKYPDADGMNRYLVHNQGVQGAKAIWGAPGGNSINSLGSTLANDMLAQSWSKQAGLTGASTIAAWLSALSSSWATSKAAAAARLSNATLKNINAFFGSTGGAAPIMSSAAIFGQPNIQFTGPASATFSDPTYGTTPGFLTNQGTAGAFVVAGSAPTTMPAHVLIGA